MVAALAGAWPRTDWARAKPYTRFGLPMLLGGYNGSVSAVSALAHVGRHLAVDRGLIGGLDRDRVLDVLS